MNDRVILTGLVLGAYPYGEYDRRLVVLTKERGKVTMWANGARRAQSPLRAGTQTLCYGRFDTFMNRDGYRINSVEVGNYFPEITGNIERTYLASYFCELADYETSENVDEHRILVLLYQSLRAISNDAIGPELARLCFEFKMFWLSGEGPELRQCVHCRKASGEKVFSVRHGGRVCRDCAGVYFDPVSREKKELEEGRLSHNWFNLSEAAWYTLEFISQTPAERLFTFTLRPEVLSELNEVVGAWKQNYLDHRFNSLESLGRLDEYRRLLENVKKKTD